MIDINHRLLPRPKTNAGFTLLEVVLAIGLTAVVLGLLITAMKLYLFRVDASRVHTESAQLARSLLNEIADDLRATRFYQNTVSSSESSSDTPGEDASDEDDGNGSGDTSNESSAESSDEDSTSLDTDSFSTGLFGTETELLLDRTAQWSWERATREVDPDESISESDVPYSVRYFVREGENFSTQQLASEGVFEDSPDDIAGLCRERMSTAARLMDDSSNTELGTADPQRTELLAPEVVEIAFAYSDGTELVDQWDSAEQKGLPQAVEIRLKVHEKPFEAFAQKPTSRLDAPKIREEDLVEYRLLVFLPQVQSP